MNPVLRAILGDNWCDPDDAPVTICNGPHWSHVCRRAPGHDEATVTMHVDQPTCQWCGAEKP